VGRRDWGRGASDSGKHQDNDGIVSIELIPNFVNGGASEASDMLNHLIMVFLKVGVDGVVRHGG
jgi:hypothetical protein